MSLGPLGMSSGMDINSMVSKIVDAERVPKQARIDSDRMQVDTNISAYGRLRESLDTMKNLMANFRQEKAFAVRTVESTDDDVVSATATTEAIAGRYAIDVLQLAQSHKVASDTVSDDTRFGPGKLQVSLGEQNFTVDVQGNARLMDVVRGINGASDNPGVRASIINDAEGQRLIVASDRSGADHHIKIGVESEAGNPLKKFEYKTLEERVKALEVARNAAAEALAAPLPGQEVANPEQINTGDAVKEGSDPLQASSMSKSPIDSQNRDVGSNNNEIGSTSSSGIAETRDGTDSSTLSGAAIAGTAGAAGAATLAGASATGAATAEAAATAGTLAANAASAFVKPENSIPGWSETASGTLLDSYTPPLPELDEKALNKMGDVPGWSNTASGTLTDSYVTPKEAQAAEELRIAEEEARIEAQKAAKEAALEQQRAAIDDALAKGTMTDEQARQAKLDLLSPEEKARQIKIDETQAALESAEQSLAAYSGMTEVQEAQDSVVMLDGIAQLSSENNVIEDAIDGIDITVKGVTDPKEKTTEIGVEYDRRSVRDDIEQFVNAYNQFYKVSSELSSVDPRTGQAGPLAGDSVVRGAQSRLKSVLSTQIENAPVDLKTLTEFGITGTRQGTLEINYEMLDRQLNNNFTKLEEFFGGSKGFAKKVEDAVQSLTGVTGSIRTRENSLRDQNYRLNDAQDTLDRRMVGLEERTKNKFMAMQDATAKMQGQLSGMMSALG